MENITHYVKIEDGKVVECLRNLPPDAVGDWREAVEIRPQLTSRQLIENPYFVLDANPIEIRYNTVEFSVEDRKNTIKGMIHTNMEMCIQHQVLNEVSPDESLCCNVSTIEEAVTYARQKISELSLLQTHDQLDGFTFDYIHH